MSRRRGYKLHIEEACRDNEGKRNEIGYPMQGAISKL